MAILRILFNIAYIFLVMKLAMAANYTVGAPNGGWNLLTSLQAWANTKNFSVGDSLTFVYAPNHSVLEVSKADYDACQTNNPIESFNGGMTLITLTTSGNRYFICGTQGHCDRGMKVVITATTTTLSPSPLLPSPAPEPAAILPPPPSASPVKAPSSRKAPSKAPAKAAAATPPAKSPSISTDNTQSPPVISPFPDAAADSPSTTIAPSSSSSATKISAFAGTIFGFCSVIMMLVIL